MKCPMRVDALVNFGDFYEGECAWWQEGCIIIEIATKEVPEFLPPKLSSKKLFTVAELSSILNMKEDRIYTLARQKILPSVIIGRQVRFSGVAIEEFIEKGGRRIPSD